MRMREESERTTAFDNVPENFTLKFIYICQPKTALRKLLLKEEMKDL